MFSPLCSRWGPMVWSVCSSVISVREEEEEERRQLKDSRRCAAEIGSVEVGKFVSLKFNLLRILTHNERRKTVVRCVF